MSDNDIFIGDLDKAAVLAVLYNGSRSQGLGFLHYDSNPMTIGQAQAILDSGQTYFDYLQGRVMKVDLSENSFDPWLYDRDNGEGAAHSVIRELREGGAVNGVNTQQLHNRGQRNAASATYEALGGGPVADLLTSPYKS